jgi:hypothetical protein
MTYVDIVRSPGRYAWRVEIHERAELAGWHVRALGPDWGPDFLLIRRPRLLWIFAEVERGRLSSARRAAYVELRACGQQCLVARPHMIPMLERLLA